MKLGLLFAGQGSQTVGMGADFYEKSEDFKSVFDLLVEEERRTAFNGPAEKLSDTRITQPVMVAFAAGVMKELNKIFDETGVKPEMAAGLSLGEYSALMSSGVFDEETAINLVRLRGNAMAEAAKGIQCKMSAVLGLERVKLSECCRQAESETKGYVAIANLNCPGQIVIAGESEAVEAAEKLAAEAGAKRCMPLSVSGPFHTKFMEPAGQVLEEVFKAMAFGKENFPVVFNAVGRTRKEDESIKDLLVKQVSSSVYLEDSIGEMEKAGIDTVIEIGPGKALSGFVKKTAKSIKVINLQTWDDLEKVRMELREG